MATTKKATAKKTTTKKSAPKAAKKAPAKKATAKKVPKNPTGLSGNQVKILDALSKQDEMTRKDLEAATGIVKGYAALMGSPTKEIGGGTLEGRKLVHSGKHEGARGLHYTITAAGRKELEKAKKTE